MGNKAYFDMSTDLLCDLLNLPAGTTIRCVSRGDNLPHTFRVHLEHPDLPAGEVATRTRPIFRRVTSEAVEFEDWGLE